MSKNFCKMNTNVRVKNKQTLILVTGFLSYCCVISQTGITFIINQLLSSTTEYGTGFPVVLTSDS